MISGKRSKTGQPVSARRENYCYPGRYVIVQKAIWAGEEMKLFTEIKNVRRESRESDEKDSKKKRFPFVE